MPHFGFFCGDKKIKIKMRCSHTAPHSQSVARLSALSPRAILPSRDPILGDPYRVCVLQAIYLTLCI